MYSNGQGNYNLSVPPGSYMVKASKTGYYTSYVYDVVVAEGEPTLVDLILELIEQEPEEEIIETPVDWIVQRKVEDGSVLAITRVKGDDPDELVTTSYFSDLNIILLEKTNTNLSFSVNGSSNLTGKLFVIRCANWGSLESTHDLNVTWDGSPIKRITFQQMLENGGNQDEEVAWAPILTYDEYDDPIIYLIVRVNFSTHVLSVQSLADLVPSEETRPFFIFSMIFALVIIIIAAVIMFRKR
jgi:hypothetical protein